MLSDTVQPTTTAGSGCLRHARRTSCFFLAESFMFAVAVGDLVYPPPVDQHSNAISPQQSGSCHTKHHIFRELVVPRDLAISTPFGAYDALPLKNTSHWGGG